MTDDDKWQDVLDQLAYVRAALGELLRRTPEPRCVDCGLMRGDHAGLDHEFVR